MSKNKNTVLKSLKFLYSEGWKYKKSYPLNVIIYIIISVSVSLPILFIPSIAVKYLSESKNYPMFALWVTIIFFIYLLLIVLKVYLDEKVTWDHTFIRIKRLLPLIYSKDLEIDYSYFESKEEKEIKAMAENALYSNWTGAELFLKQVPAFAICLLGLIIYALSSSNVSWWMVLIFFGAALINIILSIFASRLYEKYYALSSKEWGKINYLYKSSKDSNMAKDIRNYRLANMFNNFMNRKIDIIKRYTRLQRYLIILPNLSNSLFGFVRDIVAYTIMIHQVISGSMQIGEFTLMIGILNGISSYMSDIGMKATDILVSSKQVNHIINYLNTPSQFNHGLGYPIKELTLPLNIEFKDVVFTYPGQTKPTINHLSFKINGGQKVALVGENGAGKTTIIKLLSGFYKPDSGEILINNHKIDEFNIDEYRNLLSVINQEVRLIGFPIKNIIASSLEVDEQKINKVLKEAGIFSKIDKLPHKSDTFITQNLDKDGVEFSGGETQKLMLARALYKDGALLLLDEPTSALDPIAEGELYEKYAHLTKNKTSLFISHRLSSTRFCDNILFLENGKVIEEGTHDELMKLNGEYKKIFDIQSHYYKEEE
jgi:ATP-binding cassette subfamily B protein